MYMKTKEAADQAGITVRTLHHYDKIGILKPKMINSSGYRLYTRENLLRLQQILFFKELGFSLEEISTILDAPDFNQKRALEVQRQILLQKKKRINQMIHTIERIVKEGEKEMDTKDLFYGLDDSEIVRQQKLYEEEVRSKYGDSPAFKESLEKTKGFSAKDYRRIKEENTVFFEKIASLVDLELDDPKVVAAIEEWRDYITANFYTCTPEILKGLGEMYQSDERYAKNMNKFNPKLSIFFSKAILAYCK